MEGQIARQRLGQQWFITAYIAVYIQGLYTVYNGAGVRSTVACWVWPRTRGIGSLHRALFTAKATIIKNIFLNQIIDY
jgi:hypothetical protein